MLDEKPDAVTKLRPPPGGDPAAASGVRPGAHIDPDHCRWHRAFVESGLFHCDCAQGCVLKGRQPGQDPNTLPLDRDWTIQDVIDRVGGEDRWQLIRDNPQDVHRLLTEKAAAGVPPGAPPGQGPFAGPPPHDLGAAGLAQARYAPRSPSLPSRQGRHWSGADDEATHLLITQQMMRDLALVDTGFDQEQAVEGFFRQVGPRCPLEGMRLANLVRVHIELIRLQQPPAKAWDPENTAAEKQRVELLCKLTAQLGRLCSGFQKDRSADRPDLSLALTRF